MPLRDRNKSLTLPRVRQRQSRTCAWCGRPVGASLERYGRYAYCNADCHKLARRANQAENQKKKCLRPVMHSQTEPSRPAPAPTDWKCRVCGLGEPDVRCSCDCSRPSGKANICKGCEKEKFAAYYRNNGDRIKPKSKATNRRARATRYPPVPRGVNLSPRQLARCTDNLRAIAAEIPEDGKTALTRALYEGRINGAVFEDRAGCGCLWGTIGRACGWGIIEEGQWARRFRQRWCAEVDLFGRIAPGDTPHTNPYAAVCAAVLREDANQ